MELNLNFAVLLSQKSARFEKAYISGNNMKKHFLLDIGKNTQWLGLEEAHFLNKKRREKKLIDEEMGRTVS